jgi:hypothetical protein
MWLRDMPWLLLAAVAFACGDSSPGYDGTVVVGADYVQALVSAPGDEGCAPRVQRAGVCVRTPTSPGTCAEAPGCITELRVLDDQGAELGSGTSAFVSVPALAGATGTIELQLRGCGGAFAHRVDVGAPIAPFTEATATVGADTVDLDWSPVGQMDLVCALWTGPGVREVCCGEDTGTLAVPLGTGDIVEAVYLSRGRLLHREPTEAGTVEIYRTAETDSLPSGSTR